LILKPFGLRSIPPILKGLNVNSHACNAWWNVNSHACNAWWNNNSRPISVWRNVKQHGMHVGMKDTRRVGIKIAMHAIAASLLNNKRKILCLSF